MATPNRDKAIGLALTISLETTAAPLACGVLPSRQRAWHSLFELSLRANTHLGNASAGSRSFLAVKTRSQNLRGRSSAILMNRVW